MLFSQAWTGHQAYQAISWWVDGSVGWQVHVVFVFDPAHRAGGDRMNGPLVYLSSDICPITSYDVIHPLAHSLPPLELRDTGRDRMNDDAVRSRARVRERKRAKEV